MKQKMKKDRKQSGQLLAQIKGGVHWKGAAALVVSLGLLLYLSVIQVYEIFYVQNLTGAEAYGRFLSNMLKCTLVVMLLALLWYFYAVQEYHGAINELKGILSVTGGVSETDPYSRNQELASLLDSANGVVRTNITYQTQLEDQKKLLMSNYIMRLMKGRVRDVSAVYDSSDVLGINLRSGNLQVIVFGIGESGEDAPSEEKVEQVYDMARLLIHKMVFAVFDGYLTEVDGMLSCLIFSQPGEQLDSRDCTVELQRITTLIQHIVQEKKGVFLRIAIGSVSVGISGIEKSFSEAMELFQYGEIMKEDEGVLVYREMPPVHVVDTDDYFWFKKEMQFMNCINAGDYENAATVFFEILDGEYLNNELPLKLVNCRMLGLINAMINAMGKIRLTVDRDFFERLNPWDTILNCTSIPELRRQAREIFTCINHYTENQKRQSSYSRMTEIVEYLKENYSDPNLNVSSVSDYFHLNASYLSRTFKKLMGVGLSDYIQWIRVEEAKELLKHTKLSISEISQKVGYSGVQTMNRAFKKYEGTTPGRLKEAAQK